jgi:hypothetical protein
VDASRMLNVLLEFAGLDDGFILEREGSYPEDSLFDMFNRHLINARPNVRPSIQAFLKRYNEQMTYKKQFLPIVKPHVLRCFNSIEPLWDIVFSYFNRHRVS